MSAAARTYGARIAAEGTHPFSDWRDQAITENSRYRDVAARYGIVASETSICGCHVHVALPERRASIDAMNRVRSQLSPLLALSANSPFWLGADSQYASFRTEIWSRWPTAGPPLAFDSERDYVALVSTLVRRMRSTTKRISIGTCARRCVFRRSSFASPTLRCRSTARSYSRGSRALSRALARSAYLEGERDVPVVATRQEVVRAAHWHAARYGLDRDLVDARTGERAPARDAVKAVLAELRDALEEAGDYEEVAALVDDVFARGTGAAQQRKAFEKSGDLRDVVAYVVARTEADA